MNINEMTIDQYAEFTGTKKSIITTIEALKAKAAAGKRSSGFVPVSVEDFNALNPTELGMLGYPTSADQLCYHVTVKNGAYKQFVSKGKAVTRFVNNVRSE